MKCSMHNAAFHLSLHCLLITLKQSSEKEIKFLFEFITHGPSIYTMNHPKFVISYQVEEPIRIQRVKVNALILKNIVMIVIHTFVYFQDLNPCCGPGIVDIVISKSFVYQHSWGDSITNVHGNVLTNCQSLLLNILQCMLGNFACFLYRLLIFSKIKFFQKFFQEYHQCQIVWIEIRPDNMSGLI